MRTRAIAALVLTAPLAMGAVGCLLELSPRPGEGVVHRAPGATVVVIVDASALADADAGAEIEAGVDAGGDASAGGDAGDSGP